MPSGCCPFFFSLMRLNYPEYQQNRQEDLYRRWGLYEQARSVHSEGLGNSCAVRMSLCLLKCGMPIPWPRRGGGAWTIQDAPQGWSHLKGKQVVIRVGSPLPKRGLTDVLTAEWGDPVALGGYERGRWRAEARGATRLRDVVESDAVRERSGVIAYYGLPPRAGRSRYPGHIDIVQVGDAGDVEAGGYEYFGCDHALFWPLCVEAA